MIRFALAPTERRKVSRPSCRVAGAPKSSRCRRQRRPNKIGAQAGFSPVLVEGGSVNPHLSGGGHPKISPRPISVSSATRHPCPYSRGGFTIGLYSCVGFGGGFLGTLLFGITLDQFGGTSQIGAWILSFGTCGLACLAGAAATIFLSRDVWQRRP